MRQELLNLKSFDWNDENCLLTLTNGRLNKKSNGQLENVQEAIDRVCETAAYYTKDPALYERKFKEYSYLNMLNFSTPVWANMGFDNPNSPVACYVMNVEDNTHSIGNAVPEMMALAKYGGGLGIHMNDIRGFGAPISSGGTSYGVVPWVDLYAKTIEKVSQGGVRRGNGALYLDIDHPDFYEFLKFRRTNDDIDLGINITDDFIERCDKGDKEARKRYEALLKERVEQGEPYIVYIDRVNRARPSIYTDLDLWVNGSNLCVHGDTLVLTDKGNIKIKDHVGQKVNVWNGEQYSETTIQKTGENQKLLKVTLSDGKFLLCTPYHKFYTQTGYLRGTGKNKLSINKKEAKELNIGEKLIKLSTPLVESDLNIYFKDSAQAYAQGFYSGDGTLQKNTDTYYIDLYHEKIDLKNRFKDCIIEKNYCEKNKKLRTKLTFIPESKSFVPSVKDTSTEYRLAWLAGLFDADGCVTNNNGAQSLQLASINLEFLQNLQLMLQNLGVQSKIKLLADKRTTLLPDGKGGKKGYICKPIYRIIIAGAGVEQLLNLKTPFGRLKLTPHNHNRSAEHFVKVASIEEVEGLHDTYCFNEPKKHMGVFNGILTGQCSEITLHTSSRYTGVCVLSSLNLSLYDLWKGTDLPEVAIVFLNAVNDHFIDKMEGVLGFEKAVAYAKRFRSLGLGVLGWQSYLQKNMIPFESYEAMRLNNQIFKEVKEGALKGANRNAHLLAIAPTRSNAIIANSSRSIEPWTANIHIRKENKSKFIVKNNELDRLIKIKYNDNYDQIWRDIELNNGSVQGLKWFNEDEQKVFKTFAEIDQKVIIMQAEQRAKYICQSASVDLRFPANATAKYIHDVHWYAAKECKYIKSLYYCNSSATIKAGLNTKECAACEG